MVSTGLLCLGGHNTKPTRDCVNFPDGFLGWSRDLCFPTASVRCPCRCPVPLSGVGAAAPCAVPGPMPVPVSVPGAGAWCRCPAVGASARCRCPALREEEGAGGRRVRPRVGAGSAGRGCPCAGGLEGSVSLPPGAGERVRVRGTVSVGGG